VFLSVHFEIGDFWFWFEITLRLMIFDFDLKSLWFWFWFEITFVCDLSQHWYNTVCLCVCLCLSVCLYDKHTLQLDIATIGQHHTRGNSRKLTVMRCRFDLRKYCFTNRIVNMWNSLPHNVILVDNVNQFKGVLQWTITNYLTKKNCDDMLSRFHLIPERNRRTDGRTTDGQICYINIARQYRYFTCHRYDVDI